MFFEQNSVRQIHEPQSTLNTAQILWQIDYTISHRLLPLADALNQLDVPKGCMAKTTKTISTPALQLGSLVKDTITGFTGIAISRTEFAYGCVHIRVQPSGMTAGGDSIAAQSFDDQRIEVLAPPSKKWPKPKPFRINLGDIVRDILTGATGTATSRTIGIDGVTKLIVEQPGLTADGDLRPALYLDAERLIIVDRNELTVSETSTASSGGSMCREIAIRD